ncbi:MAG TPA: conjugal transfer protein [Acidimicrobiales bacterium]|nr:conjugal transfer protein [Acidimicrobiales bacterium]
MVEPELDHYDWRPPRRTAQLATRIGLWAAVALGALGGVVALVGGGGAPEPAPITPVPSSSSVAGPVAGMAERVVEAWFTVSPDAAGDLAALFVEPPRASGLASDNLVVERVTTVAGTRVTDGYWKVTVAVDLVETVTPDVEGTPDVEPTSVPTTWYVEVAIVGDVNRGLAALTTPSVVPPPSAVASGWAATDTPYEQPDPADPMAETVEGFLAALLAGAGDAAPYLAAGVDIPALDPVPFAKLELAEMSSFELDEGRMRVMAQVRVETPGGALTYFGYELILTQRLDRWEVSQFAGAPSLVIEPPDEQTGAPQDGAPPAVDTTDAAERSPGA